MSFQLMGMAHKRTSRKNAVCKMQLILIYSRETLYKNLQQLRKTKSLQSNHSDTFSQHILFKNRLYTKHGSNNQNFVTIFN